MRTKLTVLILAFVMVGIYAENVAGQGGKATEDSKIEFVGTKTGGKHIGGFKVFSVTVDPVKPDLSGSKITVDIDVDSMFTDTGKLTNHLKSSDFFDAKQFPKAQFVSTSIQPNKSGDATHLVTGDLTMHGKTKTISFPVKVASSNGMVTIDGEFKINRFDWGIAYGKGKVHDDVTIKLAVKVPQK